MATKKKKNVKRNNSSTKKSKSQVKKAAQKKNGSNNEYKGNLWADPSSTRNRITPFILSICAVLILIFIIPWGDKGKIGPYIGGIFTGLFSFFAYLIPVLLIYIAIKWRRGIEDGTNLRRIILSITLMISLSTLRSLITIAIHPNEVIGIKEAYGAGLNFYSGGVIGSVFATAFHKTIGEVAGAVIVFALLIFNLIYLFDLNPVEYIMNYVERRREAKERELEEQEAVLEEERRRERVENTRQKEKSKKQDDFSDLFVEDDHHEEEIRNRSRNKIKEQSHEAAAKHEENVEDISSIFADPEDADLLKKFNGKTGVDAVEKEEVVEEIGLFIGSDEAKKFEKKKMTKEELAAATALVDNEVNNTSIQEEEEAKPYVFPSYEFLSPDKNKKNTVASEELRENAKKLIDTLESFKVHAKISNVSRGPTITRYELTPDEGVRVNKIAGLVDDISLALATAGVRIEAPIPGKSAVGVEVPNSQRSIVYLRTLLEKEGFTNAKSKLTVALGTDISGEPMYADIATLPHLIIAGATGMGKSVCINCMLISLIYKATPSEVKLILIDPKKVELAMYNGLPHLLMPVVTDPKKAAGTLNWAVSEMEKRFEIFESVGMRDLQHYNEFAEENDDPEINPMPRIVIIIDELADLMMTAKKDVETSICRLAQKARAAGIHVIIGTQRPSVDVITGLIKANFPSRMAFTVTSQFDSRTILDIAGAEKLIGKGDMLYAPVGIPKPLRLQGAFVDGKEVEAVVGFIKDNNTARYDDKAIEEVNKKASEFNDGGSSSGGGNIGGGGGGNKDPLLLQAIEFSIENGKASTSLLQRKLSIGYGRAAKLIDTMEEMGVVSPQVGVKPRNILITKEQYQEMILGKDNDEF